MIIIEHGKTYKEQKCPNCKCLFGYGKKDKEKNLVQIVKAPGLNYYVDEYFIICPECGQKIASKKKEEEK